MSFYASVNGRRQPHGTDAIAAKVAQARRVADAYARRHVNLEGARVLEVGPGAALGAAVLLACRGARVTVADRYLVPWDDRFHVPFFRALLRDVEARPGEDAAPIRRLLAEREFTADVVTRVAESAETLSCAEGCFDAVFSHAALEHLENVPTALATIARVTRPGGSGVHLVHFGDHRDDDRQLEYLTLDNELFWSMFEMSWGECGNRWRHTDFAEAFTHAGFADIAVETVITSPASYVADVRPRLHADFADRSEDELRTLCSWMVCRRTDAQPQSWTPAPGLLPTGCGEAFARSLAAARRMVIYGAGDGGLYAFDALERLGCVDRVVAVCDGDPNKWGTLVRQHQVTGFEHVAPGDYDTVIVASKPGADAISRRLRNAGLTEVPALNAIGFIAAYERPALKAVA